jgi:hypothetical protein
VQERFLMDILSKVKLRELGEFPVSYGTSMAILLLADSNSESPSLEAAKQKPDELWINVNTLFRNLENAIDSSVIERVTRKIMTDTLIDEITLIVNYLRDLYGDKLKLVLYQSSYDFVFKICPSASVKVPSTEKQIKYDKLLKSTLLDLKPRIEELIKEDFTLGGKAYVDFHILTKLPECENKSLWVLTHHAIDLLGFARAKTVMLLESNTARLRGKTEWNAKLTGKNIENIPFNKLTIQIFGDRGTNFNSMGAKFKKEIFQLAEKEKWNPTTTPVRIEYHLSKMNDKFTSNVFKMMLK